MTVREDINEKKACFFGHRLNHLNPPDPDLGNLIFYSKYKAPFDGQAGAGTAEPGAHDLLL